MVLPPRDFTHIALDLTTSISTQDRFHRLLRTIRQTLNCDASALLAFRGQQFTPLAIDGLLPDVLGRRFDLAAHPRLEAIARAGDVVRFPADSDLPDPFDGLIPNQDEDLKVHACIGLPLMADDHLIGALTIDSFDTRAFLEFSDQDLRTLSALAAVSLSNALMMEQLEKEAAGSPTPQSLGNLGDTDHQEMIGQSAPMVALKNEMDVVASSDLNVLILGETGVGKELVAKGIHRQSDRAAKPLVYLNCAALPESVAESELFGHVKGAFTGAISNRSGKFEMANEGTLFLDEIGELPLALQAKLLRVIQYGDLQRIGDDRSLKVNVRIIAATNKDLKQEVVEGRFRADLYHRLSVFPLHVVPLRERGDDIALLAGFFLEKCRVKLGVRSLRLSPAGLARLSQYHWPGNVRELEHAIHRAAILARAAYGTDAPQILPQHFNFAAAASEHGAGDHGAVEVDGHRYAGGAVRWPDRANRQASAGAMTHPDGFGTGLREATDAFQTHFIRQALAHNQDNWAATARQLGVDSGNLHRLAKRLGLK
ncbi:nitric oxide reductase transcriptional regulator NorR [Photobacterium sp. MCCC 1A19761]|uniref:nitric oxide reductase transcriptional regulator NorR n=1 Tax=Photobacterium sp. MCCC 1A19761 TaxID=3115000 RepID=UPI003FCCB3B8